MISDPLVSIVIPAFNASPWIADALGSALAQTWRNIEVVVVDDGSTDSTSQIVRSNPDSRLRLLRQPNVGAAAARNHGMEISRGDLFQFLDADDMLGPDKLSLQLEALKNSPRGSVASCAWGKFSATPASAVFAPEPVWTESDPVQWLIKSLSGGGMMQPAAWLVPRAIAEAAGPWNDSLSLHDDGEFFTRVLLAASRNVFVPGAKVFYREVSGSLSRRRDRAAISSAFAVCAARHRHLLAVADTPAARGALATQYAQFAYEFASAAPDLTAQAVAAIETLGVRPKNHVGGSMFRVAASLLGFNAAQKLRRSIPVHRD